MIVTLNHIIITLVNILYHCAKLAYSFIKKETLAQALSCEFCDIFKNTYRTPLVAVSLLEKYYMCCLLILQIISEQVAVEHQQIAISFAISFCNCIWS